MAKLTIDDLKKIKAKTAKEISLRDRPAGIKITVHMGTCGIAAGAREVMNALMEEMAAADRQDIRVVASGCMGMCSSEPHVTIEAEGGTPIVYQLMDSNKMHQVFKRHVLLGEIQTDFTLAKM
ncbi:MAG: (2Fe-2S) ferredoxin domain-containing protein [Desulfobacterales bacterium]|jgi:NADP-reducing hydrogenase subunit HndB